MTWSSTIGPSYVAPEAAGFCSPRKNETFASWNERRENPIKKMEKSPLISLLLLSLVGNFGVYALYGPSTPVVQLNPNNFKSKVLNSNGIVLVEFYAPWCGHCKALTPAWEKAANVLKGVATVAALDADAHQALAQEYGIRGFPTIKVFAPGKPPADYQGARDVKPIVEFALQQVKALLKERLDGKSGGGSSQKSEPSASVELNSRNFDELVLKSKELWIVEFFAPWCGHCKKLAPEWKKAANSLKGQVKLGHVDCDSDKSLMSRYNVQGFPTILVFGADKESPFPFEGARTASAIESFALEHLESNAAPPEVTELTSPDVMEEKCGSAAICFVTFLPDILDSKADGRNKYLELLLSAAEKFRKSPYSFLWSAAGKQPDLEKHVGVGGYGYPALVALNLKKKAYAPLKSAFELDQIKEFVKEAGRGGKGTLPLAVSPEIVKTEPWDGKDGEIIEEDEFSLEELMGDDTASKDEL
ncbi:PDI-like 2-2 [Perilla frutescens var. hirtella]|nr:PDI-like 2-2 [Perilla frutescens var. hirtella]